MFRIYMQGLRSQTRPQRGQIKLKQNICTDPILHQNTIISSRYPIIQSNPAKFCTFNVQPSAKQIVIRPNPFEKLKPTSHHTTTTTTTTTRRGYRNRRESEPHKTPNYDPPPNQRHNQNSNNNNAQNNNKNMNNNNNNNNFNEDEAFMRSQYDSHNNSFSSSVRTQEEQLRFDQNHLRPDTLAYIKQNKGAGGKRIVNAGNPGRDPKAALIVPTMAEYLSKQEGMKAKMSLLQKIRFSRPFTYPMKPEEDLPMIIDNNDPKVPPQLFLPRSTYPMFRLWDVPDMIPMPRKDAVVPFLVYSCIGLVGALLAGLPKVVDYTKDAEKKHLILQQEVTSEEKQFEFMKNQMTIGEIGQALEKLPRQPGIIWNPDEQEEMERLSKKIYYPA